MKRLISILTVFMILLSSVFAVSVSAASASASLTGPSTVRAGDKITLSFNLNGSGIYGASGTLSYNSSQVTLTGTSQKIASPWAVEFNGNNFVAYDNNLSSPINSNKTLFTATFTVKNVPVGTSIKISYTSVTASDGNADTNIGTVTYSKAVAAPLSTNNNLSSLKVSNATISPAFNASTTKYTASVPFSVSKLSVTATAADSKAKVSVNSPTLTPDGTTDVTVTVTAESGAKKTYTISVKRAKDPNYVASSNNKLSGIKVDGFLLSPVFNSSTDKYVVWLPYETSSVKVSATAEDSRASVTVVGGDSLKAGEDNTVKVICKAENGTEKEYTVIVKRAAAHGAQEQKPPVQGTETAKPNTDTSIPDTPDTSTVTDKLTEPEVTGKADTQKDSAIPLTGIIVACFCCIMAGAAIGAGILLILKRR